ncbi:MAG TPA: DUF1858 domain-containing protein [Eubacteriales bacterium]|nr:DUF1858 domain-containing protein [Eubacteriales bacterium]
MKINKDMKIIEVLDIDRNAALVFQSFGMGCIGCLAASGESVEEAAAVHGIDVDELVAKLNEVCK